MYTVITEGNKVGIYHSPGVSDRDDMILINSVGEVIVNKGNPITWPTDAINGLKAIVNVKAGTLRFGWGLIAGGGNCEFVVSEYVATEKKGLHSETSLVEWPEDAPAGLWLVHNLVTLECKFELPKYELKEHEVVTAVKGMNFVPFVSAEDCDLAQCDSEIRMFNEKFDDKKPVNPATVKQSTPKGKGNPILGMVLADLTNRALEGKEKYGEPLLANNGRNALWDAYQEALDLAMYLRQAIEEQERS